MSLSSPPLPAGLSSGGASLVGLAQALSVVRARWQSVTVILVLAMLAGSCALWLLPKRFQATATVVLDLKSADPISGMMLQSSLATSYMSTQVDLITSDAVARRVVADLKLAGDVEWVERWRRASGAAGDLESWLVSQLSRELDVTAARDSNLMRVSYTSPDADFAQRAANAFVKAYVDTTLDLRVAPARQYKQFFEANAQQLREVLDAAQRKLSSYQQSHGLVSSGEALDVESTKLNALMAQQVALRAQVSESSGRQQQARVQADQIQEVLTSNLLGTLRADLQRSRSRLGELTATLGDANPQVIQLRANIAELELRVREETGRVAGGVETTSSVDRRRLADIEVALEQQRAKVMRLKAVRDDAALLSRDVESAQRAYEAVLGRASQMSLESQAGQTNALVLGPAPRPSVPAFPNSVRVMVFSALAGLIGGLLLAALREARDTRIRSDEQAVSLLQQPLVTSLPRFDLRPGGRTPSLAQPAGRRARRLVTL